MWSRNRTGLDRGIVFPRSLLPQVRRRRREELKLPGVYVLWEAGGSGQLPRTYMGEGNKLLQRLNSHAKSKSKDFWTHGVAFISKDQSLNKAHVQYLEARLVKLADEAKRCERVNANMPKTPGLSDVDMEVAELVPSRHVAMSADRRGEFLQEASGNSGKEPEAVPEFQRDTGIRL